MPTHQKKISGISNVFLLLALTTVYFFTAKIGLMLGPIGGVAAPVWPPTGFALAALLIFGLRLWPAILIGAFLVNLLIATHHGFAAFGIAIGNTLEAVTGAFFLGRLGFDRSLGRIRDVLLLVGVGAFGSTLISASVGVATSWAFGILSMEQVFSAGFAWWVGDMMANLIIAPFLLIWWSTQAHLPGLKHLLEATSCFLVLFLLAAFVFYFNTDLGLNYYLRSYIFFPFLLWITYRFFQKGAATGILLVAIIAIWATVIGYGPFVGRTLTQNLLALQIFLGTTSFTFLFLGASLNERKRALEIKERAIQDRENIVAMVSHDLKNPLSVIILNAQLFAKNQGIHHAVRIQQYANKMQKLIEDILDITRVQAGTFVVVKKLEDIRRLMEEAMELLLPLAGEKSIELNFRIDDECRQLDYDHERILQVLSNLVGNAIRFTPGQGAIQVKVHAKKGEIQFTVTDTGPGVSPDQLPHLFDRFWQANSGVKQGIGLGLTIAKTIVEAHGGRIWAEAQPGEGGVFHFTLPKNN